MTTKWKLASFGLLLSLGLFSAFPALATYGELRTECRNLADDAWVYQTWVPPSDANVSLLGNIGDCTGRLVYIGNGLNAAVLGTGTVIMTVDETEIVASEISGLTTLLEGFVSSEALEDYVLTSSLDLILSPYVEDSAFVWLYDDLSTRMQGYVASTTYNSGVANLQSQINTLASTSPTTTGNWTGTFDGQEGSYYLDRANHSGSQTINTVTGLQTALDGKASTNTVDRAYEGTTPRNNTIDIYKNATVASGVAVFHLTTDGTSGGAAIFPNGIIQDSIDVEVNDAAASYQMSYALSNGNKTITVTANRLTTANILTGILGQQQANGAVVRLMVSGY